MIELVPITEAGEPARAIARLPAIAQHVLEATAALYGEVGYTPPWQGYLAVEADHCVGTCAFKSAPQNQAVEIAYFTFPEHEGRGVATQMATALMTLAYQADPAISLTAQTQPEPNASTHLLEKLGFVKLGEVEHPEDGLVWQWRKDP